MPKLNRVEANIYGESYTITGEESEEYIRSITYFVDSKMQELSEIFPNVSKLKLAVLVAVNITDELFQLKEIPINAEIVSEYENRTKQLISMLDKGIVGD
jgi:cell division protein ZapA